MDEPTVGIDPQSRNHILETVKRLNASGLTVLYTSHYMGEVEYLCTRIGIMDHGSLVAEGSLAELRRIVGEHTLITVRLAPSGAGLDVPRVLEVLLAIPGVCQATPADEGFCVSTLDPSSVLPALTTRGTGSRGGLPASHRARLAGLARVEGVKPVKALVVAGKDFLVATRDTKGLLMLILMPFLLVAVLGFSLKSFMGTGPLPNVEPFDLGIVDLDGGDLSRAFRSLLDGPALGGLVRPVELSEAEARDLIARGELAGAIVFPKGYSDQIRAGDSPSLPVLVDAGQNIYPRIIGIVAREFGDGVLAVRIATRTALEARPVSQADGPDLDAAGLAAEVGRRIAAMTGAPAEEAARKGAKTTPFQYYAAAMSTMFLLFAGRPGSSR